MLFKEPNFLAGFRLRLASSMLITCTATYIIHKRSLRVGSIQIQIEIQKGWCTADTDSKV